MYFRNIVLCNVLVIVLSVSIVVAQAPAAIADWIAASDDLTILQQLLDAADPTIRASLANPTNSLTLFAPTDQAWQLYFDDLGTTLDDFIQRDNWLNDTLRYHMVPLSLLPRQSFEGEFLSCREIGTLLPDSLLFLEWDWETPALYVNNESDPLTPTVFTGNGVVYTLDKVLPRLALLGQSSDHTPDDVPTRTPVPQPPRSPIPADFDFQTVLANDGRFTHLLRLLAESPHALNSDGLYMLFAPTDAALEQFFAANNPLNFTAFSQHFGDMFVSYNVLPGYLSPDLFFELFQYTNASYCSFRRGQRFDISATDGQIFIGDVPLSGETLLARNGIIFVTDGVHIQTGFRG